MSEHNGDARKKPAHYDELFPGRFLKAGLLGGKAATLKIAAVDTEPLPQDNGRDRVRGILSFEKTDKQLVLNSTNGQCLRAMFGTKLPDWVGKRVTLKPDRDRFGREVVDCIRVAGSPDIAETITIEVQLPRKKPRSMTLEKTAAAAKTDAASSRDPGQEG
jgi:hypothetical protein